MDASAHEIDDGYTYNRRTLNTVREAFMYDK